MAVFCLNLKVVDETIFDFHGPVRIDLQSRIMRHDGPRISVN